MAVNNSGDNEVRKLGFIISMAIAVVTALMTSGITLGILFNRVANVEKIAEKASEKSIANEIAITGINKDLKHLIEITTRTEIKLEDYDRIK